MIACKTKLGGEYLQYFAPEGVLFQDYIADCERIMNRTNTKAYSYYCGDSGVRQLVDKGIQTHSYAYGRGDLAWYPSLWEEDYRGA